MHALELVTQVLLYGFAVVRAVGGMMSPGGVVAFVMYFTRRQDDFVELASNLAGMFTFVNEITWRVRAGDEPVEVCPRFLPC